MPALTHTVFWPGVLLRWAVDNVYNDRTYITSVAILAPRKLGTTPRKYFNQLPSVYTVHHAMSNPHSALRKIQVATNFKKAEGRILSLWDSHAILGDHACGFVLTASVTSCMHPSAGTRANMMLCFMAANGIGVSVRGKNVSRTSFCTIF